MHGVPKEVFTSKIYRIQITLPWSRHGRGRLKGVVYLEWGLWKQVGETEHPHHFSTPTVFWWGTTIGHAVRYLSCPALGNNNCTRIYMTILKSLPGIGVDRTVTITDLATTVISEHRTYVNLWWCGRHHSCSTVPAVHVPTSEGRYQRLRMWYTLTAVLNRVERGANYDLWHNPIRRTRMGLCLVTLEATR